MARVLYSEHQSFRQVLWIWLILIPCMFISFLSVFYGFYQQVIEHKPWGNEPMSDAGLTAALIIVIVVNGLVIWLVASLQLEVEITKDEFRYRLFSFRNWKVLTRDQIKNYSVEKFSFRKSRGLGYHVNAITKTERVIFKPNSMLTLNISGGRTIILGTGNKEELERSMQKLMSPSEIF